LVVGIIVGFGTGWFVRPTPPSESEALANFGQILGVERLPATSDEVPEEFKGLITVTISGTTYTFPAFGAVPAIPGHFYKWADPETKTTIVGFHFNARAPEGMGGWEWSSDAGDKDLLYISLGVWGTCASDPSSTGGDYSNPSYAMFKKNGYVHFHQMIGSQNMTYGFWLYHYAVREFTFEGPGQNPQKGQVVKPGIDWKFPNICEGP
jgi:hypothetical protein